MDKLTQYKKIVKSIFDEIVSDTEASSHSGLKVQFICDDMHGQYLLYNNTWVEEKRYYGCFLHIEVANTGKVWVHHDGTDTIVVEKLLAHKIPSSDIVLGFRAPIIRPDTGFAVA